MRGWTCAGCPPTSACPRGPPRDLLADADGVLVPGGFGIRGIEGKIAALRYARLNRVPALGLCLGLQCMVVEAARNLAGLAAANSTEFDPSTPHPVVATMADQMDVVAGERDMGGTMRLGLYPARLLPGSVAASAYGELDVSERHRHRYEVANAYRDGLSEAGFVFSGTSPDGRLVEVGELPRDTHPFYLGTQAHPEFRSRAHTGPPAVRRLHRGGGQARRVAAAGDGSGLTPVSRVSSRWWPPGER